MARTNHRTRTAIGATILALSIATTVRAETFSMFAGGLQARATAQQSYSWQLDFRHPVYRGLGLGATWLNEGHLDDHHRDGMAGQVWLGTTFDRWSLAIGGGPYFSFDTTRSAATGRPVDSHGWGALWSAVVSWQIGHRWVHELRVNRVTSAREPGTLGLLYGLGYRFHGGEREQEDAEPHRRELSALAGASVRNSFSSETVSAKSVELRGTPGGRFEWTVAWLAEGTSGPLHREGFTAEGWLVRRWHEGDTTLGLGAGPYVIVDRSEERRQGTRRLAGYATLSVSQRFAANWRGRFSFSRVVGLHPFDRDVLLAGASYEF